MPPKIILGDLIWSEICVFVARRIMFGRPTLNLRMHSHNRVMSVQTGCNSFYDLAIVGAVKLHKWTSIPFTDLGA